MKSNKLKHHKRIQYRLKHVYKSRHEPFCQKESCGRIHLILHFPNVNKPELRHLKHLWISNRDELICRAWEHKAVIVFANLLVVFDIFSSFLLSLPQSYLVKVFEVPYSFLANSFEELADQEGLEKRNEEKSGEIMRVTESEFQIAFR